MRRGHFLWGRAWTFILGYRSDCLGKLRASSWSNDSQFIELRTNGSVLSFGLRLYTLVFGSKT